MRMLEERRKLLKDGEVELEVQKRELSEEQIIIIRDLGVFHNMLLKYTPKRLHIWYMSMMGRMKLAVLDHKYNVDREQATTKEVQLADPEVDSAELLMHPDLYTLARYVESVEEAREIEEAIEEVAEEMTELEILLAWALLQGQHDTINVLSLQLRYQKKEREKEELTLKAEEIRDRGGVKTTEDPLTRLLDPVLQRYHAKRQAYHSQAFVENHVNAMLKVFRTVPF
ncbi:hypothetical protein Bbelb_374230 [Branchiostoma belcheri]|nr:hypothetical protein Bbelb_374230 [Branchiostoma belcheri]